jgi:hypothetical protein
VGAAELDPPALGKIALFPTVIDVVFSSAVPDVTEPGVVQLVTDFSLDGVAGCAAKGAVQNKLKRLAIAARRIFVFMVGHRFSEFELRRLLVGTIVPPW